jgi:hypothetical protein
MADGSKKSPGGARGFLRGWREHLVDDEELSVDLDVDFSEHLEAIRESLASFVNSARKAGLDAPVPTAPEWHMRDLVAHMGMVHRWATDCILGRRIDAEPYRAEGIEALEEAPVDLEAYVFLNEAPAPRLFWARRQCHETTIHSVDALAAQLGRLPNAEETWVTQQVSLDGIDELLIGFLTREKSTLRSEQPLTFSIRPNDVDRSWLVHVSAEHPVVERGGGQRRFGRHQDADHVLEGTAEQLYLALWNRSDEVTGEGYALWRSAAHVDW